MPVDLAEPRDRDEVAIEVDVAPSQSGKLGPPKPGIRRCEHERLPAGTDYGRKRPDLFGRSDPHFGVSLGTGALERAR